MIAVSNDFKQAMTSPVKQLQGYLRADDIVIADDTDLIDWKISATTSMCKSAMRKLEAKFTGDYSLLGKWVNVGFAVKLANDTYESLDYGKFLISEITYTKDTGVTTVVGYDSMVSSMVEYKELDIQYPTTLLNYTKALCRACNLELGNTVFGSNLTNSDKYEMTEDATTIQWGKAPSQKIPVKVGATYTLSAYLNGVPLQNNNSQGYPYVYLYDADDNKIGNDWLNTLSNYTRTKTVTETNASYVIVRLGVKANAGDVYTIKLEENDHATPYTPYNPMNDWAVNEDLFKNISGVTYRDILVQVAQATATTCMVGTDNKIYFKRNTPTGETLTYDNMIKLKLGEQYGEINSVVLSRTPAEDNIYRSDEASIELNGLTEFKIENNQFIDKDRDSALDYLYPALHGITYYPFEANTEGLGWFEIGDSLDIVNDVGDTYNTTVFDLSITLNGALKEVLKTTADTKTQTQYQYASTIAKQLKNTEIIVNKQDNYIKLLNEDVYEEDGKINKKFTEVYSDMENIVNTVQGSGGNNLILNSVMFAVDENGNPKEWTITDETGYTGTLEISTNTESLNVGAVSGNSFELSHKYATQTVKVRKDDSSVAEEDKTYYTFSTRIKKNTVGRCYVRIYNSIDNYLIEVPNGEEVYYKEYSKTILPNDNYLTFEFYGDGDAEATFTDNMLTVGQYKSQWTQANGEIMNTQVNISVDGVLVKSSVYIGDYTVMSPLEFAGYSNINGQMTRVFSLNKETTKVTKLKVEQEVDMAPIKIVPITTGNSKGWAFVPITEVD